MISNCDWNSTKNHRSIFVVKHSSIRAQKWAYQINSIHSKNHCAAEYRTIIKRQNGRKAVRFRDQNVHCAFVCYALYCRDYWSVYRFIWSKCCYLIRTKSWKVHVDWIRHFCFGLDIMYSLIKCTPLEYPICVWLTAKYRPHGVNGKSYAPTQRSMHFYCPKCRMSQAIAFTSIWLGKQLRSNRIRNDFCFFSSNWWPKFWIVDIWTSAMIWRNIGAFICLKDPLSRYQHVHGKSFEWSIRKRKWKTSRNHEKKNWFDQLNTTTKLSFFFFTVLMLSTELSI